MITWIYNYFFSGEAVINKTNFLTICKNVFKGLKGLKEGKYNFELINSEQVLEDNDLYKITSITKIGVKNAKKDEPTEKLEFDDSKCKNDNGFIKNISGFIKQLKEIKDKLEDYSITKELDNFKEIVGDSIHKGKLTMITDYKENSITFLFEINCIKDSNEAYGTLEIKIKFKDKFALYIQDISNSIAKKIPSNNVEYTYHYILMILCILILVGGIQSKNFLNTMSEIGFEENTSKINELSKYMSVQSCLFSSSN